MHSLQSSLFRMTALSHSFVISQRPSLHSSSGSSVRSRDKFVVSTNLTFGGKGTRKLSSQRSVPIVQASYSDYGRPSSSSIFVGGFVLGGLIVGTLGFIYAPQINRAITDTDKKDLMKKLPKFIYDEDKALEKQRKKLAEKIKQLNSDLDTMSSQFQPEEPSIEASTSADDIEVVA